MKRVAKILGADVELGNVLVGATPGVQANARAARILLAEIEGIPAHSSQSARAHCTRADVGGMHPGTSACCPPELEPQDWGRKFLDTTGGCFYIDLDHLEACIPEVCSARAFVAAHHANLLVARAACGRANARLGPDERILVMANNSDRMGNSWGGHLNVLVSRDLWIRTFDRMYPALFVLAAFQTSSILYTGQGKVGAENGKPRVRYQLSQRGDHFERLVGPETTCRRPICNARDEAHVGHAAAAADLARLHVIFHDTTLTHSSNYLKAGVTQLVLAMLEAGWCDCGTVLDDPLAALTAWGHDPSLQATASLADRRRVTAVEHQQMFARAARRFVEAGDAHFVPEAEPILGLWEDTLDKLARRDLEPLAARLDWVMKLVLLERMIDRDPSLTWESPAIRAADLLFASLDPDEGLYWAVEAAGGAERIATQGEIRRAMREPPADTRAWARTMLLRQIGRGAIDSVNWDEIRLRLDTAAAGVETIRFDDPRHFTKDDMHRLAGVPTTEAVASATEPIARILEKG